MGMSFIYEIRCQKCNEIVGELSLEEEPSADKLIRVLSGYKCDLCATITNKNEETDD
jgi:hypothetical protein